MRRPVDEVLDRMLTLPGQDTLSGQNLCRRNVMDFIKWLALRVLLLMVTIHISILSFNGAFNLICGYLQSSSVSYNR